ncbi:hypothetical protein [Sulfurimonas sp.]
MQKQIRNLLFSLFLLGNYLNAENNTCKLDSSILAIIAKAERSTQRETGYSYLISFNNKKDATKIKNELGSSIFLDNRTIDCRNKKLCIDITSYLIKNKIINLDLGAFQINYKYHKMPIESYFSFKDSYYRACNIIEELIKKNGYNWQTIARYHSATPKYNYAYLKHLSNIKGLQR